MIKVPILGVRISTLCKDDVIKKINSYIFSDKSHFITTPNPEIILNSQKDEELFYILNSADISIADGIGIKFAGLLDGKNIPRISGADLSNEILAIALDKNKKVGVLNWEKGFSKKEDIEKALINKYPELKFKVEDVVRGENIGFSKDFKEFEPDILFVGLGSPWQEKFIYHNIKKIPSIRLAIGIGGAFDFLTGKKKRALKIIRILGLEWLWRLAIQPNRIKRIFNAFIIFTYSILMHKLYYIHFYRPNVACFLYKKIDDNYQVLVVERNEEPNHWQLPQGGTDGETVIKAGERELSEELNCNKFIAKRVYKNVHKYKFGNRVGETALQAKSKRRYTGYKGQKQGLFVAEFMGDDDDIKINFWDHTDWKWVDLDELENNVHLIRKEAAIKFINKFKEMMKI